MKSEDITGDLEQVRTGLQKLGRDRKVVLSHHESFDLIAQLNSKLEKILGALKRKKTGKGDSS